MEIAGRAGGLVPTNRIALRDIVLYGGEPREVLEDPLLERDTERRAPALRAGARSSPTTSFVIASNSGINGVVVELALLVKERGHDLIAVTSLEHTGRRRRRGTPAASGSPTSPTWCSTTAPPTATRAACPNRAVGAVSSVTAAVLAQQIVTEVVDPPAGARATPRPIYLSANMPGGNEHNLQLEARYAGRIRRTA